MAAGDLTRESEMGELWKPWKAKRGFAEPPKEWGSVMMSDGTFSKAEMIHSVGLHTDHGDKIDKCSIVVAYTKKD